MHNRITVSPGSMMTIELAGLVDGSGGFAQSASGYTILSCDTNTYSGATVISGGNLWVGRPGSSSGLWGSGDLTNSSSVYFYSGRFGAGRIMNSGSLYFDRPGSYGMSNHVSGTGTSRVRCKSEPVFSGNLFSNGYVRVIDGVLTLTNGAGIVATGELTLADPQAGNYTNTVVDFPVTGIVNITQGTWINAHHIVIGNPAASGYGQMLVGVINQYGGQVSTYGATAESNGIRIAHYPTALGTYNMKGGTLTVDGGWDLCVATDGTGWVHQTGGEIFASRVMLNERTDTSRSFGRLTVSGGVLNIGLTNGISNVEQDGIAADGPALYLVEFGGAGGVVRAQTNFATSVKATLYGVGTAAITFDTQAWGVTLSGNLTGDGGLNKTGTGHADALGQQHVCRADARAAGLARARRLCRAAGHGRGALRRDAGRRGRAAACGRRSRARRSGGRRCGSRGAGQVQALHDRHMGRRVDLGLQRLGPAGAVVCPCGLGEQAS